MQEELEQFEKTLEDGLVKMCKGAGLLSEMLISQDIEDVWERYLKEYVEDAVKNINDYPQAAIGFAAFLGMAVAHNWDKDWNKYKDRKYSYYYGTDGFDNMDDHILQDVLGLDEKTVSRYSKSMFNCASAAIDYMDRSAIERQTSFGFYALVRCYCVLFRLGASIELHRLGYRKVVQTPGNPS